VLGAIAFARIVPYLDNSIDAETHRAQQHQRTMETITTNPVDSQRMKDALQSSTKKFLDDQAKWRQERASDKANQPAD
jgi:hypothetical protein